MSRFASIEELAEYAATKPELVADYSPSSQFALRNVGTELWLLFDARVPSPIASRHSWDAHRYKVIGYDIYPVGCRWRVGERIDNVRKSDGFGIAKVFPVKVYKFDDRGCYTDYPNEWQSLIDENAASFADAMSGEAVAQIVQARFPKDPTQ